MEMQHLQTNNENAALNSDKVNLESGGQIYKVEKEREREEERGKERVTSVNL